MKKIIVAPDLVRTSTYNMEEAPQPEREFLESLVRDANIHTFHGRVEYQGRWGLEVGAPFFHRPISQDKDIITYRQDIMRDMMQPEILSAMEAYLKIWNKRYDEPYTNPTCADLAQDLHGGGLHNAGSLMWYVNEVNSFPKLPYASQGLRDFQGYVSKIRDSPDFQEVDQWAKTVKAMQTMVFSLKISKQVYRFADDSESLPLARAFGMKKGFPVYSQLRKRMYKHVACNIATALFKKNEEQLLGLARTEGTLGFYISMARYFTTLQEQGFDVCIPTILPKEDRVFKIRGMKNPLVLQAGASQGYKVVPNDVSSNPESNLFMITGPNNGGKTTYMKTIALMQYLAQKGMPIVAKSAEISMVDNILTHVAGSDDMKKAKGWYANEMRRIGKLFELATPFSLVIVDEPCRGTSPEDGEKQSRVLLESFHELASTVYFTSHQHSLADYVDRFASAKNLQAEWDEKKGATHRIIPGKAGKSYAEAVAAREGVTLEDLTSKIKNKAKSGNYESLLRSKSK